MKIAAPHVSVLGVGRNILADSGASHLVVPPRAAQACSGGMLSHDTPKAQKGWGWGSGPKTGAKVGFVAWSSAKAAAVAAKLVEVNKTAETRERMITPPSNGHWCQ
jgi:hypothetical protein